LLGCHVARWGDFDLMVGWRSYEEGPEAFVLPVYYLLVGFALAVLRFRYAERVVEQSSKCRL
jgi:hypothetical protein